MRLAYLECFSGISGDMFLGALVDAGVPVSLLQEAIAALGVGAELRVSKVDRSGITATKVDVLVKGEPDRPRDEYAAHDQHHDHSHGHDQGHHHHGHGHEHEHHSHEHDHLHDQKTGGAHTHSHGEHPQPRTEPSAPHEHSHRQSHDHSHAHGRHLSEIKRIIQAAKISPGAKQSAIAIFEALGAAEAKIHNMDIERMHFHEVGAVDALADIVGAAVGAEALGVDAIVCSTLNVGGGTVKCAHGVFPVPAPATIELLKGAPVYSSGVQAELVTPTGAAIVKVLARRFDSFPPMKIEKTGYGAGSRDFPGHPNVVRLAVGEAIPKTIRVTRGESVNASGPTQTQMAIPEAGPRPVGDTVHALVTHGSAVETISVLEANLDDLSPQVIGYVMDRLLAEGALDVFEVPVQMKKNRPGTLLTVLCKPGDADQLTGILFAETTTLGVRRRDEQRQVLARRWEPVETEWGAVRIKVASCNGTVTTFAPEYEDCRRIAEERGVPLKTVMLEALQAYTAGLAAKKSK
jgi:uncharacterized protein (TIGR00299 family) protein